MAEVISNVPARLALGHAEDVPPLEAPAEGSGTGRRKRASA